MSAVHTSLSSPILETYTRGPKSMSFGITSQYFDYGKFYAGLNVEKTSRKLFRKGVLFDSVCSFRIRSGCVFLCI